MDTFFNPDKLAEGLSHFGIAVPAALAAAVAIRDAAVAGAATNPIGDLEADLLAGTIKPKDVVERIRAAALEITATDNGHRIVRDLDGAFRKITRRAAFANAETMLADLKPHFDDNVGVLKASADIIGIGAEPDVVLGLGPTAAQAWQQQTDAIANLEVIRRIRRHLANTGYGGETPDASWFVAELTLEHDLQGAMQAFSKGGITGLITNGFQVRLNTETETDLVLVQGREAEADAIRKQGAADPRTQAHNQRVENERKAMAK